MEVADDSVFAECDVSGFVWVLGYGGQGAVAVVFDYDGDVVHVRAVPECYVAVGWRVVGVFAVECVLQCLGAVVSHGVYACGVSVYCVGVGGWDVVYVSCVAAP